MASALCDESFPCTGIIPEAEACIPSQSSSYFLRLRLCSNKYGSVCNGMLLTSEPAAVSRAACAPFAMQGVCFVIGETSPKLSRWKEGSCVH